MTVCPVPITRAQRDFVQRYYPQGYGCAALAEALEIDPLRVRTYINRSRKLIPHAEIERALPPLPSIEVAKFAASKGWAIQPTGNVKEWDKPRWGWRCHDPRPQPVPAPPDPLMALAASYMRKVG